MNNKIKVIFCTLILFASIAPIGVCSNSLNLYPTDFSEELLLQNNHDYSNQKLTANQELELVNSYLTSSESYDGFTIFSPEYSRNSYLINKNKIIVHKWESDYIQGFGSYLSEDGILARLDLPYDNPTFRAGGVAGRVELFDKESNLLWEFEYSNNEYCLHHDIEPLPNGNILMIAWETKTRNEAINAGRDPDKLKSDSFWPDHIIEVKPIGTSGFEIVWEWHIWDHLIQDFDSTKDNFGVVEDHPELIDINFGNTNRDWTHTNGIDYSEELDQIILSIHNFNEIWVIDHSTTTAEAAGHTGGNSGKGGDILYRWGNPHAYRAGTTNDRKLFGQHDTSWIKSGYPGEGDILIFNNGVGRGYSTVEEITPPVDENGNYTYTPGTAYGPDTTTWQYIGSPPSSFYSNYVSGAIRLTDDNTIICSGAEGEIFEVTSDGTKLWQYTSPYPNSFMNDIFKVVYIPTEEPPEEYPDLDCEGSLNWDDVSPGATVIGSFDVKNIGTPDSLLDWSIVSYPDWGNWSFSQMSGEGLSPDDGSLTVNVEVVVPNEENSEFEGFVRVENQNDPEDFELIPITLKTPVKIVSIRTLIEFFLEKLQNFFQSGFLYRFFTQKIRDIF